MRILQQRDTGDFEKVESNKQQHGNVEGLAGIQAIMKSISSINGMYLNDNLNLVHLI